jgi:hypothetical protein
MNVKREEHFLRMFARDSIDRLRTSYKLLMIWV